MITPWERQALRVSIAKRFPYWPATQVDSYVSKLADDGITSDSYLGNAASYDSTYGAPVNLNAPIGWQPENTAPPVTPPASMLTPWEQQDLKVTIKNVHPEWSDAQVQAAFVTLSAGGVTAAKYQASPPTYDSGRLGRINDPAWVATVGGTTAPPVTPPVTPPAAPPAAPPVAPPVAPPATPDTQWAALQNATTLEQIMNLVHPDWSPEVKQYNLQLLYQNGITPEQYKGTQGQYAWASIDNQLWAIYGTYEESIADTGETDTTWGEPYKNTDGTMWLQKAANGDIRVIGDVSQAATAITNPPTLEGEWWVVRDNNGNVVDYIQAKPTDARILNPPQKEGDWWVVRDENGVIVDYMPVDDDSQKYAYKSCTNGTCTEYTASGQMIQQYPDPDYVESGYRTECANGRCQLFNGQGKLIETYNDPSYAGPAGPTQGAPYKNEDGTLWLQKDSNGNITVVGPVQSGESVYGEPFQNAQGLWMQRDQNGNIVPWQGNIPEIPENWTQGQDQYGIYQQDQTGRREYTYFFPETEQYGPVRTDPNTGVVYQMGPDLQYIEIYRPPQEPDTYQQGQDQYGVYQLNNTTGAKEYLYFFPEVERYGPVQTDANGVVYQMGPDGQYVEIYRPPVADPRYGPVREAPNTGVIYQIGPQGQYIEIYRPPTITTYQQGVDQYGIWELNNDTMQKDYIYIFPEGGAFTQGQDEYGIFQTNAQGQREYLVLFDPTRFGPRQTDATGTWQQNLTTGEWTRIAEGIDNYETGQDQWGIYQTNRATGEREYIFTFPEGETQRFNQGEDDLGWYQENALTGERSYYQFKDTTAWGTPEYDSAGIWQTNLKTGQRVRIGDLGQGPSEAAPTGWAGWGQEWKQVTEFDPVSKQMVTKYQPAPMGWEATLAQSQWANLPENWMNVGMLERQMPSQQKYFPTVSPLVGQMVGGQGAYDLQAGQSAYGITPSGWTNDWQSGYNTPATGGYQTYVPSMQQYSSWSPSQQGEMSGWLESGFSGYNTPEDYWAEMQKLAAPTGAGTRLNYGY